MRSACRTCEAMTPLLDLVPPAPPPPDLLPADRAADRRHLQARAARSEVAPGWDVGVWRRNRCVAAMACRGDRSPSGARTGGRRCRLEIVIDGAGRAAMLKARKNSHAGPVSSGSIISDCKARRPMPRIRAVANLRDGTRGARRSLGLLAVERPGVTVLSLTEWEIRDRRHVLAISEEATGRRQWHPCPRARSSLTARVGIGDA